MLDINIMLQYTDMIQNKSGIVEKIRKEISLPFITLYETEGYKDYYILCSETNQITSLKEIDKLKQLILLKSDITDNIEYARQLIKTEIRRDKISDIE